MSQKEANRTSLHQIFDQLVEGGSSYVKLVGTDQRSSTVPGVVRVNRFDQYMIGFRPDARQFAVVLIGQDRSGEIIADQPLFIDPGTNATVKKDLWGRLVIKIPDPRRTIKLTFHPNVPAMAAGFSISQKEEFAAYKTWRKSVLGA